MNVLWQGSNASLLNVKKKGLKKRRGLVLEEDTSDGPLNYPVGLVGHFCKIKHMAGVGYISYFDEVKINGLFQIQIQLMNKNARMHCNIYTYNNITTPAI
jgi:hypothetical protein